MSIILIYITSLVVSCIWGYFEIRRLGCTLGEFIVFSLTVICPIANTIIAILTLSEIPKLNIWNKQIFNQRNKDEN